MKPVRRVYLVFVATVLQVVVAEGKKGGKGKEGGGGGGSTGGITVGIIAGIVILAVMILKYRSYVMRLFGRGSTARGDRMYANEITKDSDLEGNAMKRYPSLDSPIYPTSPPPPVQYNQMDWRRNLGHVPPQIHPGPPSFPLTPYMGAAYSPSQYSPAQPFPTPLPPPMPYSPVQPAPAYGQ